MSSNLIGPNPFFLSDMEQKKDKKETSETLRVSVPRNCDAISRKTWYRELAEDAIVLILILAIARVVLGAHMIVPLVAVTSGSMEHHFDADWWEENRGFWLMRP